MSASNKRQLSGGQVLVRMTAATKAALCARAIATNTTEASVARDFLVSSLGELTEQDRCTVPLRGRVPLPADDVEALTRLAAWVARDNGATVQLAQGLREAGHSDIHADVELVLADKEQLAREIRSVLDRIRKRDALP